MLNVNSYHQNHSLQNIYISNINKIGISSQIEIMKSLKSNFIKNNLGEKLNLNFIIN